MTESTISGYRLSPRQEYLWKLLDQGKSGAFACRLCLGLNGPLDRNALDAAIAAVVNNNEALRTSLRKEAEMMLPLQVIHEDWLPKLQERDLSHMTAAERQRERTAMDADAAEAIGMNWDEPPVRFCLMKFAADEYLLHITISPLLADGGSMNVLAGQLAFAYRGLLPEEELIPLVNISEWHHEMLSAEEAKIGRDFWLELDTTNIPHKPLPFDRQVNQESPFQPAVWKHAFSLSLYQSAKNMARTQNVEVADVLLAAWCVLLRRLVGERALLVCIGCDGRTDDVLADVIGPLEQSIPLPCRIRDEQTFSDLVDRLAVEFGKGREWQDYFTWDRALNEEQHPHPAFPEFAFAYHGAKPHFQEGELQFETRDIAACSDRFALKLRVTDEAGTATIQIHYDTVRLRESDAMEIAARFQALLAHGVRRPQDRLLNLPLFSGTDYQHLAFNWNDTDHHDDRPKCLHRLIEEQAQGRPNAVALRFQNETWTYGELQERANRAAYFLIEAGIRGEDAVGAYLERGPHLVAGMLAIMKAGAIYVPLDPSLPEDRLQTIAQDAKLKALITLEKGPKADFAGHLPMLFFDRDDMLASLPAENPAVACQPNQLAYVIYTSGSTGVPKGVMVSHEAAANHMLWMERTFQLGPADRFLHRAPMSFDASIWELTVPLIVGGQMVLAKPGGEKEPAYLTALARDTNTTVMQMVPTMLNTMIQHGNFRHMNHLRYLFCAGEVLTPSLQRAVHKAEVGQLVNMYGPTETAIDVTFWLSRDAWTRSTIPIGKPLDNTQCYVLNECLQGSPLRVPGHLYIGGINLARGYVNQPALTALKFIPDPFSSHPGSRLYVSGDLAYVREDGNFEFLGRIDHQVKFHGFRIELGEIESVLAEHEAVKEIAVVLHKGDPTSPDQPDMDAGHVRLVAFMVLNHGATLEPESLRTHLGDRVPEYMIPGGFFEVDQLPLTPSGKLDRGQLEHTSLSAANLGKAKESYVAPSTPIEQSLVNIWEEVLKVEPIGTHHNYFNLGGDSIRSISIIGKAGDLGIEFSAQDLLESQTISTLARRVQSGMASGLNLPETEPFSLISSQDREKLPAGVEAAYPLTTLQKGMIYLGEARRETAPYYNVNSRLMSGHFNEGVFHQAVTVLMASHPTLRTSIHYTGFSEPMQLVHAQVDVPLKVVSLKGMTAEEQENIIKKAFFERKFTPFDFEKPPLFMLDIFIIDDNSFRLIHTDHHAILDGWSVAAINTELFNNYVQLLDGKPCHTKAPKALFRDYVALEKRELLSPENRSYWQDYLAGATPLVFPRNLCAEAEPQLGAGMAKKIDNINYAIPDHLAKGLKGLARRTGVPLKSVCMAVHLRVIAALTGQQDLMSGYSTNGRLEREDGERVLGLFLNLLPFRIHLDNPNETWQALAKRCFAVEQEMVRYRRFPVAEIVQMCGLGDLFEITFNFVDFHVYKDTKQNDDLSLKDNLSSHGTNFTLMASFSHHPFQMDSKLDISYNPTQVSEAQAVQITNTYIEAIKALTRDPEQPIGAVGLWSDREREKILTHWNQPADDFDGNLDIGSMVAGMAAQVPDRVAVVDEERSVSYAEFNRRADQLAHLLRTRGVGAEDLVALYFERSISLMLSIVAVLKTGAAYVPIEPNSPAKRVAAMVADAGAKQLVTQTNLQETLPEALRASCLNVDRLTLPAGTPEEAQPIIDGQQLAYVIYTSGSTGVPKGVGISHAALANYVEASQERFALAPDASMSMLSAVSADLGNTAIFGALCTGRSLRVMPPAATLDSTSLGRILAARPVDCLKVVPSLLKAHMAIANPETLLPKSLLVFGGEALDAALVDRVHTLAPHCRIINHYGPTEATIGALTNHLDPGLQPPAEGANIPIGHPLGKLGAYVMDGFLQPMPIGAEGELYLTGTGLARGYLGQPKMTASRFLPYPLTSLPGQRMYRTGDRVRYLEDGKLVFLGRMDQQVKIRGYRVEISEIEWHLKGDERVRDAAVTFDGEDTERSELTAFVVPAKDDPMARSALRETLAGVLPDYMVPSVYVFLDQLPLNANGKVDRQLLLKNQKSQENPKEHLAPRNELESLLCDIWKDVLDVQQLGVRDNFFELGGNSLLAMLVVTRIRQTYTLNVSVQSLFEAVTVEELAEKVNLLRRENALLSAVTDQAPPNQGASGGSQASDDDEELIL